MINEATLIISLVFLILLIMASVGYLFYIIIDRFRMKKWIGTFYIIGQVLFSFLIATGIYQLILPFVDPSNLHIENLRNYSFYYVISWNAYFAVITLVFLINAIIHRVYARKKFKDEY
ncbi:MULTISPECIES: hypothetical protein [Bacillaceae]|uniref:NADH dehydrogenase subunit 6 n=1 Tax=Evansella alkalicola TaxID=745819 RepID=A0ABS6JYC8_9BACI|nr:MULTISPECIES: hypothetical protein [Bacillaceae]MBU9723608.1 hypothetical protein [Bacillus alkalicola]